MTETEQSIHIERFTEGEDPEDRLSLIEEACQLFTEGYNRGFFTFKERTRACGFLSTLVRTVDRDAGDLCLLGCRAENLEQLKPI